ncbi:hypothetical protein FDA94_28845 [Herbidospora galbida]|uniref:Uncharacterized protein n=1 Tax=Herbidospora galbida TaxID=2575442 RepID=A0A4U3M7X0_9ACTN|nr:hypothetical protein [Herbidospora galbida]TKK84640.1 hypothetical protein FDA94_28845 [Herbidospora galbida]
MGRILHSLGVSISTLRQLDREREGNDVTLVESRHAIKNHFTRSAWLLLVHLQRLSDQGLRWVNIKDEALQQLPASVGASTIAITRPWLVEP